MQRLIYIWMSANPERGFFLSLWLKITKKLVTLTITTPHNLEELFAFPTL
jgi:hypothetical protein